MNKSFIWRYFSKIENYKAECKKCKKIVSNIGGSTSAMRSHAQSHISKSEKLCIVDTLHNTLKEEDIEDSKKWFDQSSTSSYNRGSSQTLLKYLNPKLNEYIAKFATLDGLNFQQIVSSSATVGYLKYLGFECPKSIATVRELILSYYNECLDKTRETIKTHLRNNLKFSITLDEWICVSNRRYLNINLFCNSTKFNLGLYRVKGRATSDNISSMTKNIIEGLGIDYDCDIIAITTDAAAVMKAAFKNFFGSHQLCYNHGIHLAVMDALYNSPDNLNKDGIYEDDSFCEDDSSESGDNMCIGNFCTLDEIHDNRFFNDNYNNVILKIRKICKTFRKSSTKGDILEKEVLNMHNTTNKLVLDVNTRWNSLFFMCQRYYKIKDAVSNVLRNLNESHLDLSNDEKKICETIINVLQPVTEYIEYLSNNTTSLFQAHVGFKIVLDDLNKKPNELAKNLSEKLRIRFNQRFDPLLYEVILYLSNYELFYNENVVNRDFHYKIVKTREAIKNLYTTHTSKPDAYLIENVLDVPTQTFTLSLSLRKKIEDLCEGKRFCKSGNETIDEEISIYEKTNIKGVKFKIIQIWLSTIQPTSTESERVFSVASSIKTKIRNRLSDKIINALVFLKYWFQKK